MTRIVVIPADTGIAIGTFIFDNDQQKFAYSNPIMYDSWHDALKDYHDAVVNGGELPFHIDEGIEVWLVDLDAGYSCSFWSLYKTYKASVLTDNAKSDKPNVLLPEAVLQTPLEQSLRLWSTTLYSQQQIQLHESYLVPPMVYETNWKEEPVTADATLKDATVSRLSWFDKLCKFLIP